MKILLLSDCNSVHTIKWATSLVKEVDVYLFSIAELNVDDYNDTNVQIISANKTIYRSGLISKFSYLGVLPRLKKVIKQVKPDIVHAHYATSYGFIGALLGFKPLIVSVWGADVFDFPNKTFIHRKVLEYNLSRAVKILSTSHVMAKETEKYTQKNIEVTPFGINMEDFKPQKVKSIFSKNDFVIGTIKTLEEKYGIRYLIDAFHLLVNKYPEKPLKLLLVGGGSQKQKLEDRVVELGISNKVVFTGKIPFRQVPVYHNMLDVYVALSVLDSESFGVAIVEASSTSKPVVVSNVGGLPEVVDNGVTGIVVPKKNSQKAFEAIDKILSNYDLREQMGKAGRERVFKLYNWNKNVKQMLTIYRNVLK